MTRARSIEVYLKPGIDEDDVIHRVWEAVAARGRPQETFRRLLILGIRAAVENGEMPRAGLEAIDLDILMPVGPATALLRAGASRANAQPRPAPPARPRRAEPQADPVTAPAPKEEARPARLQDPGRRAAPIAAPEPGLERIPTPAAAAIPEPAAAPVQPPADPAPGASRSRLARLM